MADLAECTEEERSCFWLFSWPCPMESSCSAARAWWSLFSFCWIFCPLWPWTTWCKLCNTWRVQLHKPLCLEPWNPERAIRLSPVSRESNHSCLLKKKKKIDMFELWENRKGKLLEGSLGVAWLKKKNYWCKRFNAKHGMEVGQCWIFKEITNK